MSPRGNTATSLPFFDQAAREQTFFADYLVSIS